MPDNTLPADLPIDLRDALCEGVPADVIEAYLAAWNASGPSPHAATVSMQSIVTDCPPVLRPTGAITMGDWTGDVLDLRQPVDSGPGTGWISIGPDVYDVGSIASYAEITFDGFDDAFADGSTVDVKIRVIAESTSPDGLKLAAFDIGDADAVGLGSISGTIEAPTAVPASVYELTGSFTADSSIHDLSQIRLGFQTTAIDEGEVVSGQIWAMEIVLLYNCGVTGSGGVVIGGEAEIATSGDGTYLASGGVVIGGDAGVVTTASVVGTGGVVIGRGGLRYRRTITVPSGQVSRDIIAFPLMVKVELDPDHATGAWRFTTTLGVDLPYEIRSWEDGVLAAVVRVDLTASSSTTIHLYYG